MTLDQVLNLPTGALVALAILLVLEIALLIVGVIAWAGTPEDRMPAPGKWLWLAIIVFLQILGPIELHRIDEDADDDALGALFGFPNQGQMPLMQIAHGRHEGNSLSGLTVVTNGGTQRLGVVDHLHELLLVTHRVARIAGVPGRRSCTK